MSRFIKLNILIILLHIVLGCSGIAKQVYLIPSDSNGWIKDTSKLSYDSCFYKCENKTLTALRRDPIYFKMYSTGPCIFPVIPVSHLYDKGYRSEFELVIRVQGIIEHTKLSVTGNIYVPKYQKQVSPSDIKYDSTISSSLGLLYFIRMTFKMDMTNIDTFILNFDGDIEGCAIPPLIYEKVSRTELISYP